MKTSHSTETRYYLIIKVLFIILNKGMKQLGHWELLLQILHVVWQYVVLIYFKNCYSNYIKLLWDGGYLVVILYHSNRTCILCIKY